MSLGTCKGYVETASRAQAFSKATNHEMHGYLFMTTATMKVANCKT